MRTPMVEKMTDVLTDGLATATRRGATAARIGFGQRERIGCGFENGRLKGAETVQGVSYTVTVLCDGRKGSAAGTDPADLDEIIDRAVALAKVGSAAHFDAYPAPAESRPVEKWSARTLELPREKLIDSCQQIVDALKSHDPGLFIEAVGKRGESEGLLVTTGGLRHSFQSTNWSLSSYVQRTEETDMLFAGYGRSWNDLTDLYDPDYIAGRIIEDLRNAKTIVEAPEGRCAAILSPDVLDMMLWAVEMGVNGRNVAKGDSPLRGRLGEKVLDESITLIDDPHRPFAPGAAELDSNGVPTRPIAIFNRGVLENFLYDLDSAGLAGAEPTGNDACSPHCAELSSGSRGHEELIADIADGIYLKQLLGFGQGNLINGDFSCNVALGFRVRNGEIVGRVKNAMVAGNVYELLGSGVELSSDREPTHHMPYARLEGLNVASAQG